MSLSFGKSLRLTFNLNKYFSVKQLENTKQKFYSFFDSSVINYIKTSGNYVSIMGGAQNTIISTLSGNTIGGGDNNYIIRPLQNL